METLPPRSPDQSVADRRKTRDEYVEKLLGRPDDTKGRIQKLEERVAELEAEARPIVCQLESGKFLEVRPVDQFSLMLAVFEASRTNAPVELSVNGQIVTVRIAELQKIVAQVLAAREDGADDPAG